MSGPPPAGPRISAVICTFNRHELVDEAIASCLEQDLPEGEFDVIVVDNSSDRAAALEAQARYRNTAVRYLLEDVPGLSNARNRGARESTADIVAYLDDDAIATRGWLTGLVAAYDRFGPLAAVVGGKVSPIWTQARPSWLSNSALGYLSVVDLGEEMRVLHPGEWVAGANISFRRQLLLDLGGFDVELGRKGPESSLMSNEEVAVFQAIQARGGLVVYAPAAAVSHLVDERRLRQEWFRRRAAWQAVSDYLKEAPSPEQGARDLDHVLDYLLRQQPKHRAVSGLFCAIEEPEDFDTQVNMIYCLTRAILAGLKAPA